MTENKNGKLIAIITMCFIFAMISFVTNMGAPFGNIWGFEYPFAKAWGNLMNFAAYLFMGIPAGKMLTKYGYKKTALRFGISISVKPCWRRFIRVHIRQYPRGTQPDYLSVGCIHLRFLCMYAEHRC